MSITKIIITDSNTLKQIRPSVADIRYRRFSGREVKKLMDYIDVLEQKGLVEVENKIKRGGISYGLYLATGSWYPGVEISSQAIIDVPYETIAVNISVANSTHKLDINDRENWDKGMFDLEARVMKIERCDDLDWEEFLFPELS